MGPDYISESFEEDVEEYNPLILQASLGVLKKMYQAFVLSEIDDLGIPFQLQKTWSGIEATKLHCLVLPHSFFFGGAFGAIAYMPDLKEFWAVPLSGCALLVVMFKNSIATDMSELSKLCNKAP